MVTEQVKTAVSFSSTMSVASALRVALEIGSVWGRKQRSLLHITTQVPFFFLDVEMILSFCFGQKHRVELQKNLAIVLDNPNYGKCSVTLWSSVVEFWINSYLRSTLDL